jgi:pSer/pThr/pTyr-binding forkhead associated (FHA) protein
VAALGAVYLIAASLRRRPARSCPSCARELAQGTSECAFCAAGSAAGTLLAPRGGTLEDHASPTVLARMDLTEEYLEKTVTLREVPVLTVTSGAGSGMVFSLNRQSVTSIGRAKANDIVLEDVSVSSQHARIRPEGGKFVLHDLKSTNGTFANERRVTQHVLAEGDTIKIGETYLQFRTNQKQS